MNNLIIVAMVVCVSMLFLSSFAGGVYVYGYSTDESPSPSSESPSPSPVNCELDWSEASWAPCTEDNCPDEKIGHKYRTATVKQAAKHGGRECPALTEYELLDSPAGSIRINELFYMLPYGETCPEGHNLDEYMDCYKAYVKMHKDFNLMDYVQTSDTDPDIPCSLRKDDKHVLYLSSETHTADKSNIGYAPICKYQSST